MSDGKRGRYESLHLSVLLKGKDFRRLPAEARWVFVVLKTTASGMAGIDQWYPRALAVRLSEETGHSEKKVDECLRILESEGWIVRESDVLWIVRHLTYDPHANANNWKLRKSVQKQLAGLPRLAIVRDFVASHPEWFPPDECQSEGLGWLLFDNPTDNPINTVIEPIKPKAESRKPKTQRTGDQPSGWVSDFGEDWRSIQHGVPDFGKIGAQLKPLFEPPMNLTPAEVRPCWQAYLRTSDGQYGPKHFVTNYGRFSKKLAGREQQLARDGYT